MNPLHLFLPCAAGVEGFLADEVHRITGYSGHDLMVARGGVMVRGSWRDAMLLNLHSRLSQRVLVQLSKTMYRSENDLRRVFNERTAIVDNNVQTARYNAVSLREGLISLLQTAGDRELAGKPVTAEMAAAIHQRHAELVRTRRLQQSFESQRAELDVEIADTLQRFRAMKGVTAEQAEATATAPADAPTDAQAPARR